jgi:hypothetical protein
MFKEILTKEQTELLNFLKEFKRGFYLVGGTAIALQVGHRRSIDFDLFTNKPLNLRHISDKFYKNKIKINKTFVRTKEQFTLNCNSVQVTFYHYPYNIPHDVKFENIFYMPSLLDLAAMKAFALGKRSKWKDYVDLYYIIKYYNPISVITNRADELFGDHFSEKLFRGQLSFFEDIDYEEEVVYINKPIDENEIKQFLIEAATEKF